MLKNFIVLIALTFSLSAIACWKVEGLVSVDGEDFKISQKVDHDKKYSQPMGQFIFHMTFSQEKGKKPKVHYALYEKKGATQTLVTKGVEYLEKNKSEEIYAKGEKDQPNSIITLKLTDI